MVRAAAKRSFGALAWPALVALASMAAGGRVEASSCHVPDRPTLGLDQGDTGPAASREPATVDPARPRLERWPCAGDRSAVAGGQDRIPADSAPAGDAPSIPAAILPRIDRGDLSRPKMPPDPPRRPPR